MYCEAAREPSGRTGLCREGRPSSRGKVRQRLAEKVRRGDKKRACARRDRPEQWAAGAHAPRRQESRGARWGAGGRGPAPEAQRGASVSQVPWARSQTQALPQTSPGPSCPLWPSAPAGTPPGNPPPPASTHNGPAGAAQPRAQRTTEAGRERWPRSFRMRVRMGHYKQALRTTGGSPTEKWWLAYSARWMSAGTRGFGS